MHARTALASSWVLFLSTVAPLSAQETSPPATEVARIAKELCAVRLDAREGEYDLPDTVVPGVVRRLLPTFKRALRELAHDSLTTDFSDQGNSEELRENLLGVLWQTGVPVLRESDPQCRYGAVQDIRVEWVDSDPDLLAIVITLGIPCGHDSSLYIFERREPGWTMVLVDEAPSYEEVSGGYDAFGYRMSPRDKQGRWYVVAANNTPWCTSCWNGMQYRVLRPGGRAEEPIRVFTGSRGTYRCQEDLRRIVANANDFRISLHGMFAMDFDSWIRVHVVAYRLEGDKVTRVPPLAFRPHDFVDEWLLIPWEEAAQWSRPKNRVELQRWHEALQKSGSKTGLKVAIVQECPDGRRWLVGTELQEKGATALPWVYFMVSESRDAFFMDAISDTRPAGCPGHSPPNTETQEKLP